MRIKLLGGLMTTNSQYRMGDFYDNKCQGFEYNTIQGRNEQEQYGQWENEHNNSWNYYPETNERFIFQQDSFKKEEFDRKDEEDKRNCKTLCNGSHNFRPCFPTFPCFRNNNCRCSRPDFDCRKTRPCHDNWKRPCHDYDYDRKPEYDCGQNGHNKGNRFYFSGCIEINKFDRK